MSSIEKQEQYLDSKQVLKDRRWVVIPMSIWFVLGIVARYSMRDGETTTAIILIVLQALLTVALSTYFVLSKKFKRQEKAVELIALIGFLAFTILTTL